MFRVQYKPEALRELKRLRQFDATRMGDFRVFYDADEAEGVVVVRHVRRKGSKTTGEIL